MKPLEFLDTGVFKTRPPRPGVRTPANLAQLMRCMASKKDIAMPLRLQGTGTSVTDCNTSVSGTVIRTTGLDRIVAIDTHNETVTAEAGVTLGVLIAALAERGLELIGNYDQAERTLGGALASPCMGPGIGNQASFLSSQLLSMKVVTANGSVMKISKSQKHLLNAFRLSYGMLGVIFEATLRVKQISTFSASHRSLSIEEFSAVCDRLAAGNIGLKFYLLPHKDHVQIDLRRYVSSPRNAHRAAWKLKDWGENTVLPQLFKLLHRVLPISSVRYQLIDNISEASHGLFNTSLVKTGNNTSAMRGRKSPRKLLYSTWCFPATDFSIVIKAYTNFCQEIFERTGYRCDMPAVGFRVDRDRSALLSPSFDETLIALQTVSTQSRGWEDFVIDLAEFAENWGGIPLFSQSRALRAGYAPQIYASRLEFFRKIRRQLDPENRLLNPYLAQNFQ